MYKLYFANTLKAAPTLEVDWQNVSHGKQNLSVVAEPT